jgi:hypothetical protein
MPAFASDGTVSCPFPAAWLEFFNADKDKWPANAYRTSECSAAREFSHGSFVAALPDGSFPPVFLWLRQPSIIDGKPVIDARGNPVEVGINYRVVAKGPDGSIVATIDRVTPDAEFVGTAAPEPAVEPEPQPEPTPDPREEELAALRARVAELEARDRSVFAEAPLLPAPDALMSDWGPVGDDDITGDMLLDAFEQDEAETVAVVQTLSALRLKHLSEQLNVERARLDREHQATGVANPRSASIDRLLGLLTRRGEV